MNDVNGKSLSISNFKGKYLLVDFWGAGVRLVAGKIRLLWLHIISLEIKI